MKGFGVPCPFCFNGEGTVTIDLNDLAHCECPECGTEFSPAKALRHARELAARWEAVVRWIALAPRALADDDQADADDDE